MKQDSYARFLKSELYKTCLLKELEGKPLDIPQEKNKYGKETEKERESKKRKREESEDKGKKRWSLLPWGQKASKNSMKSSSNDEAKNSKENAKYNEREGSWTLFCTSPGSSSTYMDIPCWSSRHQLDAGWTLHAGHLGTCWMQFFKLTSHQLEKK
ncbi:hypothetical protein CHS0354_018277 [Potamilus streckersoni]|uniref:RGS domain-containing protein n=1 Tax=Potamilus streckersoni TaxID=2493646 RepID=A0AAE0W0K7_9BIVA|nr:hypothetical protein CHS0354_018277 [Potamilus streckersoni]